jgi:serine/threonine protein phosphatase 1
MTTIAVGDIHGNRRALDDLLEKLLPEISAGDTLVFLGDYIDRGPDSRGCVERVTQLQDAAPFQVVALLGNHEDWLLRTLGDYSSHSWIFNDGAFECVASYSPAAAIELRRELESIGPRLITERAPADYSIFFDHLPARHRRFFEELKLYYECPDVTCVHAGLAENLPLDAQDRDVFIWGTLEFPEDYRSPSRVVYGHRSDSVDDASGWPQPRVGNRTFGIDTIHKGVLTAMRFPDGKIVQSARFL